MESIEKVEENLEKQSKELYNNLYRTLTKNEDNAEQIITIKKLGETIETHNDQANIPLNTKNAILNYKLVDSIIEGKVTEKCNPNSFDEKNFVDFFSGKDLKKVLFNSSIDEKKEQVEILTNLYGMIGGNTGGINKNNLVNSLKTFYNMIKYPDSHFKFEKITDRDINDQAEKEANEIIEFLGDDGKNISLNDFINMMTSDSDYQNIPKEDIKP